MSDVGLAYHTGILEIKLENVAGPLLKAKVYVHNLNGNTLRWDQTGCNTLMDKSIRGVAFS